MRDPAITTNKTTERFAKVKKLFATEDSLAPNASAAAFNFKEINQDPNEQSVNASNQNESILVGVNINFVDDVLPEKIRVIPKAKKSG